LKKAQDEIDKKKEALIKESFLDRINFVQREAAHWISELGETAFFHEAEKVYASSLTQRQRAMYDYTPVSVMPILEEDTGARLVEVMDINRRVAGDDETGGSKLFTFSDPELRSVAFYVTDEALSAPGDRFGANPLVKGVSRSLELFFSRTKEGQQLRERLNSIDSGLPRPASLSDIPTMEGATLKGALPEQIKVMVVLGGESTEAVQLYQKQNGFVTLHVDPSRIGLDTAISDTTEWFPKLAQAFSGLVPDGDALTYENRIRAQLRLPAIKINSSDDLATVDVLPRGWSSEVVAFSSKLMTNIIPAIEPEMIAETLRPYKGKSPYMRLMLDAKGSILLKATVLDSDLERSRTDIAKKALADILAETHQKPGELHKLSDLLGRYNASIDDRLGAAAERFKFVASDNDLIPFKSIEVIPDRQFGFTVRISSSRRTVAMNYRAWGNPLSGLGLLMSSASDQELLALCQMEAEGLTNRVLPKGVRADDARSLFTDFLFQSLKKARSLTSDEGSKGVRPLTGTAEALAGAVSQETIEHLDNYIRQVEYDSFAAGIREAAQRIMTVSGAGQEVVSGTLSGDIGEVFNEGMRSVFVEALTVRKGMGGAFQLPVVPLSRRRGRKPIDPVALSENRQPIVQQGDQLYCMVEFDAELPMLRHDLSPEVLDAVFKLNRQQGIGQTSLE
ncbi:MAG: hypothetical protein ACPG5T_04810, partial [Endozoicomonas sp.]